MTDYDAAVEMAACPKDLPGNAKSRASRAKKDAQRLAEDIRDLSPDQIWGRMSGWSPDRWQAAMVHLALGYNPHDPHNVDWADRYGGPAAFHPDYQRVRVMGSVATPLGQRILDMWRVNPDLTHAEIARRVGASYSQVQRVVSAAKDVEVVEPEGLAA